MGMFKRNSIFGMSQNGKKGRNGGNLNALPDTIADHGLGRKTAAGADTGF